jgi:hypothetical protein
MIEELITAAVVLLLWTISLASSKELWGGLVLFGGLNVVVVLICELIETQAKECYRELPTSLSEVIQL